MDNELSIVKLVLKPARWCRWSWALLLLASLMSWAIIFRKRALLSRAARRGRNIREQFLVGRRPHRAVPADRKPRRRHRHVEHLRVGLPRVRAPASRAACQPEQLLEGARRAMRVGQLKEIDRLEAEPRESRDGRLDQPVRGPVRHGVGHHELVPVALGGVQQATLAMVAPGIAEALIATAMGLFAAIPAVIAYNRYADQVSRLELRYDTFMEEFSTILQRHAARQRGLARRGPWLCDNRADAASSWARSTSCPTST